MGPVGRYHISYTGSLLLSALTYIATILYVNKIVYYVHVEDRLELHFNSVICYIIIIVINAEYTHCGLTLFVISSKYTF